MINTATIDQAISPSGQPRKIRANNLETRERIQAIIETLQPEVHPNGLHIKIPYQDDSVHFPTRVKKGMPDLAREHVAALYQQQHDAAMSTMAYKQVLKEMLASSPEAAFTVLPEDLALVTGTTDVYISLAAGIGYQRKGKIDNPYYCLIFPELPTVQCVYYAPNGAKGHITQYEVTIAGVTAILTSDEMQSGIWIEKYPRIQGVGNFATVGMYMQIMQHLAHKAPMVHNVTHTGVHAMNSDEGTIYGYMTDSGTFLTGKTPYHGCVDYAGKVTGEAKQLWDTYERIAQQWNKQQAIASINYCQQLTPTDGQALVTLCHQVRTLSRFARSSTFRTGYGMYLYGPGGNGKTSLAIMTSSVGKPYIFPEGFDATFRSTVTSIELKIDAVGDRPFIIDDLHKAPDDTAYDIKNRERTLDNIIRSATDGSPIRERANSNMTAQRVNTVKTFPTVTGEYFPGNMATSFMRRTLFVQIPENSIPRKAKQAAISLEAAGNYVPGLHKLGRKVVIMLVDAVNTRGLEPVADQLRAKHTEYYSELYDAVTTLWSDNGYQGLPPYVDSIIDAAANVMIGGYLIDHVTAKACNVVETVRGYLVNIVYSQLLVMAGMKRIDGLTPLDQAIRELFASIAEEKRVNGVLLSAEDYCKSNQAPMVSIPLPDGKTLVIPPGHWLGIHGYKTEKQVAAYIHTARKIAYLTSTGRDALLVIAATTEGLERVKKPTALSQQFDAEKWLVTRNGKSLDIPCNPQSNKAQIRCLPLALDRLIALVYDQETVEDDITSPNTAGSNVIQFPTLSADVASPTSATLDDVLSQF